MNSIGRHDCGQASHFEIAHGYLKVIANARGRELRVHRGSVWVAQHGSADYIRLDEGQGTRIASDGLMVVTAFGASAFACVTLEPEVRGSESFQRLQRLWRRLVGQFVNGGIHAAR